MIDPEKQSTRSALSAPTASIEAGLDELFADSLWISHAAAARFLGMDPKTLAGEAETGAIFVRAKGKRRAYVREDLADYIARAHASVGSRHADGGKVHIVEFTAAKAKARRLAREKPRSRPG